MRHNSILRNLLLLAVAYPALGQHEGNTSATPAALPAQTPYSLRVSVNEVGITFHASDAQNLPVLDLRPEEVDVFDNGTGPGKIISLEHVSDRPIHAAFLIDTSGSVAAGVSRSRAEAQEAVQQLLAYPTDEGTAVAFRRSRRVVQTWTTQKNGLVESIGRIGTERHDPIDGTSIFDTLFTTCFTHFGQSSMESAKVVLLFSDGEDTASFVNMKTAIDKCRENHVAIYAFSPGSSSETISSGPATLRRLTEDTGGRLFSFNASETDVHADIATVRADLEAEYFLLYRPTTLTHDGSFHRIVLVGPKRVVTIVGTTGFYAPAR